MKRILSFLLMIVMAFTVLPLGASAAQGDKLIALTFDDGPHKSNTAALLDGLKERNVKVTLFTLGQNASYYPDVLRRAYDEGHEIASHSWDHANLVKLDDSGVVGQVDDSLAVLNKICGTDSDYLFRPPYGSTNEHVRSLIQYPLIFWSVDPEDWKYRDADHVHSAIVENSYDGAIILVHDIHATSIPGALAAVDDLMAQGYEFVTVSELFRRRGVALEPGKRYFDCPNNGTDYGPIPKPEISYSAANGAMEITISADTDAPIYYTTDGSIPNEQSTRYEGPFSVTYPCDIHAVAAYKLNGSRSEVVSMSPGEATASIPTISVDQMTMTLSATPEDASIYYTLDGSDPAVYGTTYTEPVEITENCVIRAVSGGEFYKMSSELQMYVAANGKLYADVSPQAWYFPAIDRMVSKGIMAGIGDYKFAPEEKITRAMLVSMLYSYSGDSLGEGWEKTSDYTDVSSDAYYAEAAEWAYRNQILSEFVSAQFSPNSYVTRQELCKILDDFLCSRGHGLPEGTSSRERYRDYDKITSWALPSVDALTSAGIVGGDSLNFRPKGNTTRGEAAVILTKMMEYEESFR